MGALVKLAAYLAPKAAELLKEGAKMCMGNTDRRQHWLNLSLKLTAIANLYKEFRGNINIIISS